MAAKNFSRFLLILCSILSLNACNESTPLPKLIPEQNADEIVKVEKAFSDMSRQVGMKKAFMEYMAKDAVLLRPDYLPIVGADAIDFLSQINDTSFTITWVPSKAAIAASGDMAYTYGIYEVNTADTSLSGTYVNIWKKQKNGDWKFVLDTGNQGISTGLQ